MGISYYLGWIGIFVLLLMSVACFTAATIGVWEQIRRDKIRRQNYNRHYIYNKEAQKETDRS